MLEFYDEALRTVLEIPPLEREAAGSLRVVRCVFKPSFHPECAVTLIERDDAAEMTLRISERSVWSCIYARDGRAAANPVTDWVKPAVAVETVVLAADAAMSWRDTLDAIEPVAFAEDTDFGLDGMDVSGVLWRPGLERRFNIWVCHSMRADARYLLALSLLETAMDVATWERSVVGLRNIRSYFED